MVIQMAPHRTGLPGGPAFTLAAILCLEEAANHAADYGRHDLAEELRVVAMNASDFVDALEAAAPR